MHINEYLSPASCCFLEDETGAALTEYVLLIALVAVILKLLLLALSKES